MQLQFNETLTQKVNAFAQEKGVDAPKAIEIALDAFFDDWEAGVKAEKILRNNSRIWTMEEVEKSCGLLEN